MGVDEVMGRGENHRGSKAEVRLQLKRSVYARCVEQELTQETEMKLAELEPRRVWHPGSHRKDG